MRMHTMTSTCVPRLGTPPQHMTLLFSMRTATTANTSSVFLTGAKWACSHSKHTSWPAACTRRTHGPSCWPVAAYHACTQADLLAAYQTHAWVHLASSHLLRFASRVVGLQSVPSTHQPQEVADALLKQLLRRSSPTSNTGPHPHHPHTTAVSPPTLCTQTCWGVDLELTGAMGRAKLRFAPASQGTAQACPHLPKAPLHRGLHNRRRKRKRSRQAWPLLGGAHTSTHAGRRRTWKVDLRSVLGSPEMMRGRMASMSSTSSPCCLCSGRAAQRQRTRVMLQAPHLWVALQSRGLWLGRWLMACHRMTHWAGAMGAGRRTQGQVEDRRSTGRTPAEQRHRAIWAQAVGTRSGRSTGTGLPKHWHRPIWALAEDRQCTDGGLSGHRHGASKAPAEDSLATGRRLPGNRNRADAR